MMGISERRWKGAGKITTDKHTFVYSGGDVHEKGVGMLIDQATAVYDGVFGTIRSRNTCEVQRQAF
eukprot:gene2605-804_t